MQAAKKLVLVDPQFLEQLKVDREYKQIQKPTETVAKTNLSLDIGKTLHNQSLSDDQKVKQYLQTLNRYLHVGREFPETLDVKPNPLSEVVVKRKKAQKNQRRRKTWVQY